MKNANKKTHKCQLSLFWLLVSLFSFTVFAQNIENVGYLVGEGSVSDSYYDSEKSFGLGLGVGDENGKTTAQMKTQNTYSGWDFEKTWNPIENENADYPILLWQTKNIARATISPIQPQQYTGSPITPDFTLTLGGVELIKDTDYTVSSSSNIDVGTATITVTGKEGRYIGSKAVTFGITRKPVTVTANASSKVYGTTADPAFTYSVEPALITGDTFTGSLSRAENENVGTYTITLGSLANSNYKITFVPANFTITPKPITITEVTAVPRTPDGTTSVTLKGGTLNGVLPNDVVNFELGSGTISSSSAGTYSVATNITLTGTGKDNYELTQPTGIIVTISGSTGTPPSSSSSSSSSSSISNPPPPVLTPEQACDEAGKYWYNNMCNTEQTPQQICQASEGVWYKDNCYATQAEKDSAVCYEKDGYYWEDGKCKRYQITVTVTFNTNSGTVSPASATVGADGKLASLPTPTRYGYKFDGWFTAATGGTQVTTSTVFSANTTIYAQWTAIYTVTYDGNGNTEGSAPTARTLSANQVLTLSGAETLVKTGYSFDGWNTAPNGSGISYAAGAGYAPAGNVTLYAKWKANTYTITYTLNNGTVATANPASYNVETATITLNNPTRTGYTFAGWTGSNGTTAQTTVTIAKGSTGDKTYAANWTLTTYTVTFNANGGTALTPASGTTGEGGKLASLPTPTRTDYTFNGWFTAATGGTQVTTSTVFSANTTIYAQWTASSPPPPPPPPTPPTPPPALTPEQVCDEAGKYWYNNRCNSTEQTPQQICQANKGVWYKDNCYATQADKNEAACYEKDDYYWEDGKCKKDQSTPVQSVTFSNLIVKAVPDGIRIENLPANAKVDVFNLQGKRVYSAYPENPKILRIGVQTGVYIIKIGSQSVRAVVK